MCIQIQGLAWNPCRTTCIRQTRPEEKDPAGSHSSFQIASGRNLYYKIDMALWGGDLFFFFFLGITLEWDHHLDMINDQG